MVALCFCGSIDAQFLLTYSLVVSMLSEQQLCSFEKNLFKMGRRPNIWNIRTRGCRGSSSWVSGYTKQTKEIAKFDIEKLELLPFVESKKYVDAYRWRHLRTPITHFLRNQVGRDYDEVYSELVKQIPKKMRHCIDIYQYKMPSSFHPELSRWYLNDREGYGFFVDLDTRVLGYVERIGRRQILEEERAKPVYQPFRMDMFKIKCPYGQNFVFKQLLTYEDFEAEAATMKHCIRSYWSRCTDFPNKTSIWSLSHSNCKILTIQIVDNQLVQIRGQYNRKASDEEKKGIEQWTKWLRMSISEYAF